MSIMGLIMLTLVNAGSLGFATDPLAGGVSFKLGAENGVQIHLLASFGSGENSVDSAKWVSDSAYYRRTVYDTTFWKPYSALNFGGRVEYYFSSKSWFQPYVGIGVGWKKESRWVTIDHYADTVETLTPELTEQNYFGPIGVIGVDFFPVPFFAKMLKLNFPYSKAISFNIEVCPFYLIQHDFKWPQTDDGMPYPYEPLSFSYYSEHAFSGIGGGIGIHYNWGKSKNGTDEE